MAGRHARVARTLNLHRFHPRVLDALAGYDRQRAFADIGAGITVGIVALPLAMAFAIASGLKPEQGLVTAIVAGFLISALGGSNVQIGGPAGAFIVIVYGIVERYGLTGGGSVLWHADCPRSAAAGRSTPRTTSDYHRPHL